MRKMEQIQKAINDRQPITDDEWREYSNLLNLQHIAFYGSNAKLRESAQCVLDYMKGEENGN